MSILLPAAIGALQGAIGTPFVPGNGPMGTSTPAAMRDTVSRAIQDAPISSGSGNRGYINNFSGSGKNWLSGIPGGLEIPSWAWIVAAGIVLAIIIKFLRR